MKRKIAAYAFFLGVALLVLGLGISLYQDHQQKVAAKTQATSVANARVEASKAAEQTRFTNNLETENANLKAQKDAACTFARTAAVRLKQAAPTVCVAP